MEPSNQNYLPRVFGRAVLRAAKLCEFHIFPFRWADTPRRRFGSRPNKTSHEAFLEFESGLGHVQLPQVVFFVGGCALGAEMATQNDQIVTWHDRS